MNRFAYDYSVLPKVWNWKRFPTNLTECIWSEELSALLSLCMGIGKREMEAMSDYEKGKALHTCIPMLMGHPLVPRSEALLSKILCQPVDLCASPFDDLWRNGADILAKKQESIGLLLANQQKPYLRRIQCDVTSADAVFSMGMTPILDGNSLLNTQASHWKAWEYEMNEILERFIRMGCDSVVLTLDEQYTDVLPDPYHVDKVLAGSGTAAERHSMMLAQVFRFLSLECEAHGLFMILHLYCSGEQGIAFIRRSQAQRNLPKVLVTTPEPTTAAKLMQYCLEQPERRLECALLLRDYPSEPELSNALDFYAARYPFGCLRFITGGDFRFVEYDINTVKHLL